MRPVLLLLGSLAMPLAAQAAPAPDAPASVPWADAPILTPAPGPEARLHGPKVFGVRPGSPLLYAIPATGTRPMAYAADGLPSGLALDPATGRITGSVAAAGTFPVVLHARNAQGDDSRPFKIVVGDDISLTPAMGWNSWNCWAAAVDADKVRRAAQAMVSSGLAQHGWSYVNIDDSWQGVRGGPFNGIQANRKFPDMKALCDEIHGMGLKVGIYSTPWTTSFAGHAGGSADTPDGAWTAGKQHWGKLGAVSFAQEDARQWAAWGLDYLKYDWHPNEIPEVKAMADALRASGRDIVFSVSTTAPFRNAEGLSRLANSWRTTGDIYDKWQYSTTAWAHSVPQIGFAQDQWAPFAGPGHWNDPDMLVLGWVGWGKPHPTRLTAGEQYTHMSLWALLAAPLIMGGDLERLDAFTLGLLTNDEVIDIDQDPLGKEATQTCKEGDLLVYVRPLEDGSHAVGFFNTGEQEASFTVPWKKLGLPDGRTVRDVWRQKDLGAFPDGYTVRLPSHGSFLARVGPAS